MKLSQFRFDLPLNLIAQHPSKKREESRLMVVNRATGYMENRTFAVIIEYFDDKDVFAVNNTKVFPARMYGRKEKTGAKIEIGRRVHCILANRSLPSLFRRKAFHF